MERKGKNLEREGEKEGVCGKKERESHTYTLTLTHTHTHAHTISSSLSPEIQRERMKEREREREREGEIESERDIRVCAGVCVCERGRKVSTNPKVVREMREWHFSSLSLCCVCERE